MPVMDPGFYQKLMQVTSEVGMKPEDLLNVMAVESGIDPTAHNANGNASGLIQFMPSTLRNLGYRGTHADFRKLSAEEQLDYVKKYIMDHMKFNGGPFKSAAQYYVANFVPAALKLPGVQQEDPKTVLVAKNPKTPHLPGVDTATEHKFYDANQILDDDHNGEITYGDIQSVLNKATGGKNFRSAIAQLQATTGYHPSDSPSMLAKFRNMAPANDVEAIVDKYLRQIAATEKYNLKLYRRFLPTNHVVIQVTASDFSSACEFARILCHALDENLLSTSFVHAEDRKVEVECAIMGPEYECLEAVKGVTETVATDFQAATKKIGGIKVNTQFLMNKKSSYQKMTLRSIDLQYKKFLLKFM